MHFSALLPKAHSGFLRTPLQLPRAVMKVNQAGQRIYVCIYLHSYERL